MASEEDVFVVIIGDESEDELQSNKVPIAQIKKELLLDDDSSVVSELLETAEKHGSFIDISCKTEPPDEEQVDYIEDDYNEDKEHNNEQEEHIDCSEDSKDEMDPTFVTQSECSENSESDEFVSEKQKQSKQQKRRFTMLKASQRHSFVQELRDRFPELKDDEDLLVATLTEIMYDLKTPDPPEGFCIQAAKNKFLCGVCKEEKHKFSAVVRHYQERHGERYLTCYACGVDFKCTTNLYKHEKRCVAPDVTIVLKARANYVGSKGRSRPFLTDRPFKANRRNLQKPYSNKATPTKFPCELCSAVFTSRLTLQSHTNLHRGEKPYQCQYCPCAYTSASALSRHVRTHSNDRYVCDNCGRQFKIKTALIAHMDTHRPFRKHGCELCDRRFSQRAALRLHVDRVHRHLPPPCACHLCPKRYPRMSLLKNHMLKNHGLSIMTRKMFFKALPSMTETELKQAKTIMKADIERARENDILFMTSRGQATPPPPSPPPALEPTNQESPQAPPPDDDNYIHEDRVEIKLEVEEDNYVVEGGSETETMLVEDFLEYIKMVERQSSDTQLIVIQDGKVVDGSQADLLAQLEGLT